MKLRKLVKPLFFIGLISILVTSCKKDEPYNMYEQLRIDEALINEYITENNLETVNIEVDNGYGNMVESGVHIAVTEPSGSEEYPQYNSTVEVKYTGYLLDGTVFDEQQDEAVKFHLSQEIIGLQIGIPAMAKGDKATIIIPSPYAYGPNSIGDIPSNSVLVYEVELIDFQTQDEVDAEIIEAYIEENDLTTQNVLITNDDGEMIESGVHVAITEASGSEVFPDANSIVSVIYKGYLVNGEQFDSSNNNAVEFKLSNLIQGWQIGLSVVAKGDKATMLIPSSYGYGSQSVGTIPANSVLIFDVELEDITL